MIRSRTTAAALAALLLALAGAPALAAEAPDRAGAAVGPLVVAPPVEGPNALDLAVDILLPTAAAVAGWTLVAPLMPGASDGQPVNAVYAIGSTALGLAAPGGALTYLRTKPFAWDMFLVAITGGVVGMATGFLGARLATGGKPEPMALAAALGVGEGLGTAAAYHLYRRNKSSLRDLDRLPVDRTDDPIEDWQFWKEKRNP